jgi:NO-binding membrane sensor protein with MHYT domain
MSEEKKLTEQESIELISAMIQKVKNSYHDTGIGSLLWGTVVFIASFVSFLRFRYNIDIGFDIWLLVLGAIIPQVYLSIRFGWYLA